MSEPTKKPTRPSRKRNLDYALEYAARSWHVFPLYNVRRQSYPGTNAAGEPCTFSDIYCTCPQGQNREICKSAGKHPRHSIELKLRNGLTDATTDPAAIRAWWEMWPAANIAIVCGRISGILAVDIDVKNGGMESWAQLCAEFGEPATLRARTGGGGYHYIFTHPGDAEYKSKAHGIAQGVDVKADGGYIVAAPSVHVSGYKYSWDGALGFDTPIAPCPQWVLDRLEVTGSAVGVTVGGVAVAGKTKGAKGENTKGKTASPNTINTKQYTPSDAEKIATACPWLRHCRTDAATLSELDWYHMVSILARCTDGPAAAHEWSRAYPGYSPAETDKKIAHACADTGPTLCTTIATQYPLCAATCPNFGRVNSPINLGGSREKKCTNYLTTYIETDTGKKPVHHARPIDTIAADLVTDTNGWPKSVSSRLFIAENLTNPDIDSRRITYLDKPDAFYGWVNAQQPIAWRTALDDVGYSYPTKNEFAARLPHSPTTERYDSVELLPHEPPFPQFFYLWDGTPTDPQEAARLAHDDHHDNSPYLDRLLSMIDNCETPADRALIRALFLTPAAGLSFGKRPLFIIEANEAGSGKTTITEILSMLYGGILDYQPTQKAQDEFLTRMLSPVGRACRLWRYDNADHVVGGQFLDYLVTASDISGRELYNGEGARPNILTGIVTGNTIRLHNDMTQRTFTIKLTRPEESTMASWAAQITSYVRENRYRIIADILGILRRGCPETDACDRWGEFVHTILARCWHVCDPCDVMDITRQRRGQHNTEVDEAQTIIEALRDFRDCPIDSYYDESATPMQWRGYFVTRKTARDAVEGALGLRGLTARTFVAIMDRHIRAGHFQNRVRVHVRNGERGYVVAYSALELSF